MSENPAQQLANFAAQLRFADLPPELVSHIKLCLLDTIGCGLFGSTLPWTRILAGGISEIDSGSDSVIWGTGQRLGCANAALVNGAAAHGFELDDLHPRSILHPGSVVVSASLAIASRAPDLRGARFLTALVAGYEVGARAGMCLGTAHLLAGWHPTGTHGTLAAAAACGSMLGLDGDQMRDALGIAATQAGGLMAAQYGSMVKRFHAGRAAQSGLYGALLARRGYAGIKELFEATYGSYFRTFSPRHDAAPLTEGLSNRWETLSVGFKPYAANGSCHPTIDALLELRRERGVTTKDVEWVDVRVSSATLDHVGWPYTPGSVTTAQMNLPYIVAVVLTDGDAFVDQFTESRIRDTDLIELSRQVRVSADPDIDAGGDARRHATKLDVHLIGGEVVHMEREFARGSARAPLSTDETVEKYYKLATKTIPEGQARQIEEVVQVLEGLDDISPLVDLLTAHSQDGS